MRTACGFSMAAPPREARARRRSRPPVPRGLSLWPGLPGVEQIATEGTAVGCSVPLPFAPEDYAREADALRREWPKIVWDRAGKPDKIALGSRAKPEDWSRYRNACPGILDTAELLLGSLAGQTVEVTFGDVLDYREDELLGWHQDNMDLSRHTFTAVLTLLAEGDGCFEWREITDNGHRLGDVVASQSPRPGDLAIHGLSCNNALAHRALWAHGRRLALVMFCRSAAMEEVLRSAGLQSRITMRHWWTEDCETAR